MARTLFKEVEFYNLVKDLELPGEEKVVGGSNGLGNVNFIENLKNGDGSMTNGSTNWNNNERVSLSQTVQNLGSGLGNNNAFKKIGPKLSNKDGLSFS